MKDDKQPKPENLEGETPVESQAAAELSEAFYKPAEHEALDAKQIAVDLQAADGPGGAEGKRPYSSLREYEVGGVTWYLTSDLKLTTEKPVSEMSEEEAREAGERVPETLQPGKIESWSEFLSKGEQIREAMQDAATAEDIFDALAAALKAREASRGEASESPDKK